MSLPLHRALPSVCLLLLSFATLASAASVQHHWTAGADLRAAADEAGIRELVARSPLSTEMGERPELPLQTISLAIPAGERIRTIRLENLKADLVTLPTALPDFAGAQGESGERITLNAQASERFPAEHVVASGTFVQRGFASAEIVLAPLLYESDGEGARLQRLLACDIVVETESDPDAIFPRRETAALIAAGHERHRVRVANPQDVARFAPESEMRADRGIFSPRGMPSMEGSGVDLLIITAPEYVATFETLAEYKTALGIATVVRDTDWIQQNYPQGADLQETIRFFIRDAYEKWGIGFLILAGDTGVIPARYAHSNFHSPAEDVPCDLYYAQLDGNWNANGNQFFGESTYGGVPGDDVDFIADIHLGRMPVRDAESAELMVDKVMTYVSAPDTSYVRNVTLLGEVLFPSWYQLGDPDEVITRNGADYCEMVYNNYILPLAPQMDMVRFYETWWLYPGSLPETITDTLNDMETRAHILHHVGHGYRYTMSVGDGSIVSDQVEALTNGLDHLINFYALNCTSCAIDFNSLGEAILLAPEGGSITSIGTVREAYPNTSVYYQNSYYSRLFADSLTVGEVFTLSHNDWAAYGMIEGSHRWTQLTYVLMGDPTLDVMLDTPWPLDVSLTVPFTLDSDTLYLSVDSQGLPVEGARVTAYKASEDRAIGHTDALGEIALPVHAESPGDLEISVVARNRLIWQGSVTVGAGTGPRLSVDLLQVRDDPAAEGSIVGNADDLLDAGETVRLGMRLYNRGDAAAANVTLDLSLPGGQMSVLEGSHATGTTVAAGDSLDLDLIFLLSAPQSLANGLPVLLDLALGYDGGAQTDQLDVLVHAPVPNLFAYVIDDSGGDGDGEPDSGETYTLEPEWKNYGSTPLGGWDASLLGLDPNGSVLSGPVILPVLGFLEKGSSDGFSIFESDVTSPNRFELILSGPLGESLVDTIVVRRPSPPDSLYLDSSFASTIIDVAWEIPGEQPPGGYLVYRSLDEGGPYTLVSADPTEHAYFRNDGLAESTTYYFVVETMDSTGYRSAQSAENSISTNPAMQEGWPLETDAASASSVVIGDIDGDGDKEIVAASKYIYAWHHDGVEILDGDDDSSTYGVLSGEGNDFAASVALAQVDTFTAGLEIVAACITPFSLYVYSGDGEVLPGWPKSFSDYWCWATPSVADVDGDELVEIFIVSQTPGVLYAWHHDGTELIDGDSNPATDGVFATGIGGWSRSSASLAQLDEDPELEIVVGSGGASKLFAWNHDGSTLSGWPLSFNGSIHSSPSVGDIDDDDENEIVMLCENDSLYVLRGDGSSYGNGFPVWLETDTDGLTPSPALVDFEGDGQMEIVAAGCPTYTSCYVTVLDNQANTLPGWPIHLEDSSEASPVVVDLDGDHDLEILFGTEKGYLYAWELDGSSMPGFPILTGAELRSSPTIDDIDENFTTEVAIMGWDRFVYIWDMPGWYNNGLPGWKMFRANAARTGVFTREDQIVGVDDSPSMPAAGKLFANFPNPFNPSTRIRFATPAGAGALPVTLTVHDIRGRRIRTLHDGQLASGSVYSYVWDGKDEKDRSVSSGLYFVRVEMGEVVYSQKMLLLK